MNKIFKKNNFKKGITLIEILVVVFIIALLSTILVADFPKIRRQFALTRAVYRMSQDLRKAQDMGLSGQQISGFTAKGYGVYINKATLGNKKYIIYIDRGDTPDQKYSLSNFVNCTDQVDTQLDCVIETIDISKVEPGIVIDNLVNTQDQSVDINFKPPNPTITITGIQDNTARIQIIFAIESELAKKRTVFVNTSGLIEIK